MEIERKKGGTERKKGGTERETRDSKGVREIEIEIEKGTEKEI
jgi:hypothetical protein